MKFSLFQWVTTNSFDKIRCMPLFLSFFSSVTSPLPPPPPQLHSPHQCHWHLVSAHHNNTSTISNLCYGLTNEVAAQMLFLFLTSMRLHLTQEQRYKNATTTVLSDSSTMSTSLIFTDSLCNWSFPFKAANLLAMTDFSKIFAKMQVLQLAASVTLKSAVGSRLTGKTSC